MKKILLVAIILFSVQSFAQNLTGNFAIDYNLGLKAPLASPTFTGTVTVPASTTFITPITLGTLGGGWKFGNYDATYGSIHSNNVTPTTSNYALISNGANTFLNSTSTLYFGINDGINGRWTTGGLAIGASAKDASAKLDVQSTTSGLLHPRMTTAQRDAISSPATGLGIYNTDTKAPEWYNGYSWGNSGLQVQKSRVTSQFNKTNTTLADITGLTATLIAGKTYEFEARLTTTSDVAGGVKVAIAGTATATSITYEGFTIDAGLTTQGRGAALGDAVGSVTAVTAAYITISGTITVNAGGTLTVQFAENAATATSSVLVGSRFTVTEIL